MYSWFVRATLLLMLFGTPLLSGCGDESVDETICGPSNCNGCCQNDTCMGGDMPGACGGGGLACATCSQTEVCSQRQCTSSGQCNPSNCASGCCLGGTCMPGNTTAACGGGGASCKQCGQTEVCSQNQCFPSVKCNSSNCASGCCEGDNCMPGTAKDACGSGGNVCAACAVSQQCINQSCGCDPGSCSGCCENGVCRSGTTDLACGTEGKLCNKCQSGQSCLNGSCTGSTCTTATCSGCCAGSTCEKGDQLGACGQGGATCQVCKTGESCTLGVCINTVQCGPGNCTGCCTGSQCLSGLSSTSCGAGGSPCNSCKNYEMCQAGACKLDPTSKWKFIVGQATISTAKKWDIAINTAPDPFVVAMVPGVASGQSTTKDNTYTPVWDEYLFTAKATDFTSRGILLEIRDDDTIGWELIGGCALSVKESILLAGGGTISQCGIHVSPLILKFAPANP